MGEVGKGGWGGGGRRKIQKKEEEFSRSLQSHQTEEYKM